MSVASIAYVMIASLSLVALSDGGKIKSGARSFVIDFDHDTFLKDGQPFQYVSGSIHYSRVPYYYWKDRLTKMAAAGLDAAQTYVPWNIHEPQPGVYDFDDQQNLGNFLQTAQDAGLVVILRAGPYICGEWEYGGLPAWLLSDNVTMVVRTMDKKYIAAVDRWLSVLYTYIKPYLYSNGGPVIMVQLENEYGSYQSVDCGHDYMAHLHDIFTEHLGDSVLPFTTDGNDEWYLKCGATPNVYATVDFGPTGDIKGAFAGMRKWNPKGPLVNSECYTGWLDYWGGGHAHGDTNSIVSTLKAIRNYNASVNMYMFEGGTSFGFTSGADPTFAICPTSYDYDSPLSEAGDITPKFMAIRDYISQYKPNLPPVPSNTSKYAYGKVTMTMIGTALDLLDHIAEGQPLASHFPLNMEQSHYYHGFVLYRTGITRNFPTGSLSVPGIRDRGHVMLDGEPIGIVDRNQVTSFNAFALAGQTLDIFVENQGRLNFGSQINDNKKGLISNVTFDGQTLTSWKMYPLNITKIYDSIDFVGKTLKFSNKVLSRAPSAGRIYQPAIYTGSFVLPDSAPNPSDTFLKMCGWFKGQAFINGFNLGRYWPVVGPQVTLYVPSGVLRPRPQTNVIVMLELDSSPSSRDPAATNYVEFVDTPIINSRCFSDSLVIQNDKVVKSAGSRRLGVEKPAATN